MPPKSEKGRSEAKEVAAFVQRLYAESGFSSWGEFARSAGVAAATMSDWKRGENAVSGYNLLKLIRTANWTEAQAPDLLHRRLEALEAGVLQVGEALEELAANQEREMQLLEVLVSSRRNADEQLQATVGRPATNTLH